MAYAVARGPRSAPLRRPDDLRLPRDLVRTTRGYRAEVSSRAFPSPWPGGVATPAGWPRVALAGSVADLVDARTAIDLVAGHAAGDDGGPLGVVSLNLDHLHHFDGSELSWAADEPDGAGLRWLGLLDGAPLVARARRLTGRDWPRLAGSDLIGPILAEAARRGLPVGFVGGMPEVHAPLRDRLARELPDLAVAGTWAPERAVLTDPTASAALAAEIAAAGPRILVVGLGKPRQEHWIAAHGEATGARVLLAFGAVVDFLAGRVRRAPAWVADHGMEWAWRLALEPRRLARRYLVHGPPAYLDLRRRAAVVEAPLAALPAGAGPQAVGDGRAVEARSPAEGRFVAPGEPARVAALVVTRNNAGHVEALVASLRHEAATTAMRVVVADNASDDGTAELLSGHPDVVVVATGGNLGYAGGLNAAAAHAGSVEALLVLNPDLRVEPGATAALLARLADPAVGVVAPLVRDRDGTVYRSLRREPGVSRALGEALFGDRLPGRPAWLSDTVRDPAAYRDAHAVDWASGAALLVRAAAAAAVGAWDERYFLYSEEIDYCRRVRAAGYTVLVEPTARVVHDGAGSGTSPSLVALQTLNRVRYVAAHHGPWPAAGVRAAALLGALLRAGDPRHRASIRPLLSARAAAELPRATRPEPAPAWTGGGSVVIAAHDEAPVLGRTLAPLAPLVRDGLVEVVVVPNGCRDATAEVARGVPGVRVVEIAEASKAAALRAGDLATDALPRLYLDADIELAPDAVAELFGCLRRPGVLAARPRSVDDTTGASWPVRAFFRARSRMPDLHTHLWGAGAYALGPAGRARFAEFPDVTGDDLWVDGLFAPHETAVATGAVARVRTPRSTQALLAVLRRTRRGNAALQTAALRTTAPGAAAAPGAGVAGSTARATAVALARTVRGPRSLADAAVYAALVAAARLAPGRSRAWERDETSRT